MARSVDVFPHRNLAVPPEPVDGWLAVKVSSSFFFCFLSRCVCGATHKRSHFSLRRGSGDTAVVSCKLLVYGGGQPERKAFAKMVAALVCRYEAGRKKSKKSNEQQ